jgi:AcrR family transcriptional regulator
VPLGLRERKKAKTRAAIQAHALQLFRRQGYAATTVDQIAEAAEISQSTFFRYFPTKEDLLLYDRYDPLMLAAFAAQPAELTVIEALRRAIAEVIGRLPADEWTLERERARLIMSVPELRGRLLDQIADSIGMLSQAVAERVGPEADAFAVQTFVGAVIGVAIAAMLLSAEQPDGDYLGAFDAGLTQLEAGLPFSRVGS